jgi:hypothetical protein
VLEKIEKPLDSYPERPLFALTAWLPLTLPGAVPWPDRWLPADQDGAARTLELVRFEPAREAGCNNPMPGTVAVAQPLIA